MVHYIRKSSGDVELFDQKKFKRSLAKAGASDEIIQKLIADVMRAPGITSTRDLYNYAFNYLKSHVRPIASRYSLKNALYDLGPEGFAFEKFVAELCKAQGFTVLLDQTIQGKCVHHEVDLILKKDNRHIMVECKFHNTPGIKSDVKVPLYIQARFEDISAVLDTKSPEAAYVHQQLLITNTQFTTDAIAYGECVHIKMVGWAYPEKGNIADLIETLKIHPITSLTTLTKKQKNALVHQNILLCRDVANHKELLKQLHMNQQEIEAVIDECNTLIQ